MHDLSFSVDATATKAQQRKQFLRQRQQLSTAAWQQKSKQLCCHLRQMPVFQSAHTVLSFVSIRHEPDLTSLYAQGGAHRQWGLPRCVDKTLVWHHWQPGAFHTLQTGAYGIAEPHPDSPQIPVNEVDLILVPALACSAQGQRLGYGGGFYDRLLSHPDWHTKVTIGIVFEVAYVPTLPTDAWDCLLQGVCTEAGGMLFSDTSCRHKSD
ncbi:5-formyltetrahydrofolate cyclo-ligase [Synechococcales cyanobacterium C]|uniref:5-formyltetrahydrofolate cyclo-ligase n=1 Tax=Petrachloros mirabilis ULC683 TaxID=2781853 RepID=A0A8K1ZXF5_9CYAN|nr:5-formyltetrahydrofolate cyclo-ligase [Petrachloros mirabilis]NCJ06974.1 5-formyltetrahydrofolate cyclo-ligase [Petrachloros mirabilis ULC683]